MIGPRHESYGEAKASYIWRHEGYTTGRKTE